MSPTIRLQHVVSIGLALVWLSATRVGHAQQESRSVLAYGAEGFWTGAQVGLAAGYLATGPRYESGEWRTIAFGAGVGAISGVGVGIALGLADLGKPPPATGWLVLRDAGYGAGLGALVGTAVGALYLIDGGGGREVLTGASVGALAGAAAGVAFGLIEGASAGGSRTAATSPGLHLRPGIDWARVGDDWVPLATLSGAL